MLAAGQDSAFGQPVGSQLRSCLIAVRLAQALNMDAGQLATVYWVALLRYVGCTGHAHEVAAAFGDDIEMRSRSVVKDLSDPRELLPEILRNAGRDGNAPQRLRAVLAMLAGGRRYVEMNFRTGCEVGDGLLARLSMTDTVRDSLQHTFEQWNGKGFPRGVKGTDNPLPMRVVRLAHDAEALARIRGADEALAVLKARSGRLYDPALVSALNAIATEVLAEVDKVDPWTAMLDLEPEPYVVLADDGLDAALLVAADFIDLKSPFTVGHSRAVSDLAAAAAERLSMPDEQVAILRRAGWVHDLGRTAIPNSIWDKPGPLTFAEADRVELHPLLGEQILRRCSGLSPVTVLAGQHHERLDGSGYSKGASAVTLSLAARVLAAADRYVDLTSDRAYRPALSATQAAAELRTRAADGRLDTDAVEAVLSASGQAGAVSAKRSYPAGLTEREVDVLRLAAQGLTMRQAATRLEISAKTVDNHLQKIYAKTGVGTRGALALFAVEQGLLRSGERAS